MASLANAFRSFVLLDVDVATLLGVRFYWNRIPDEVITLPYVKARTITDPPSYTHDGEGTAKAVIQMDMWGSDQASVDAVFEAIRKRVSGYRGDINGHRVRIFITNRTDAWSEDLRLFHRMLEVEIGHVT